MNVFPGISLPSALLLAVIGWLTLTGGCCCEPPPGPDRSDPEYLVRGRWEWERTILPPPGGIMTPSTCLCSQQLEIRADDLLRFRNGLPVDSTTYRIERRPNGSGGTDIVITIGGAGGSALLRVSEDSLEIDASSLDGPLDEYSRIR